LNIGIDFLLFEAPLYLVAKDWLPDLKAKSRKKKQKEKAKERATERKRPNSFVEGARVLFLSTKNDGQSHFFSLALAAADSLAAATSTGGF
jgi:hypothetical protein